MEAILEKTKKTFLLDLYKIPSYQDINHFLAFVARRKGRILPGDVPDHEQAARAVIYDWNSGKIPYYTRPPQRRKEVRIARTLYVVRSIEPMKLLL